MAKPFDSTIAIFPRSRSEPKFEQDYDEDYDATIKRNASFSPERAFFVPFEYVTRCILPRAPPPLRLEDAPDLTMTRTFQVVYAMTNNLVEPAISIAIDISHTFSQVQHSLRYYMNGHVIITKPELADEGDLREFFFETCIKQKVKEISFYITSMRGADLKYFLRFHKIA